VPRRGFQEAGGIFSFNVYITKIIVHKADEPIAVLYLLTPTTWPARLELKDSQLVRIKLTRQSIANKHER
jgi:hypothetical protein